MNYWLHRITGGENALPLASSLFDKGYLSIGFSDFSTTDDLNTIRSGWDSFETLIKDCWGSLPRTRYSLWRFINEMQAGDYVVVPLPCEFAVCKIIDNSIYTNETIDNSVLVDWNDKPVRIKENYLYDDSERIVDIGFYRKVEVIQSHISRVDYAQQDLYSRMKIRQTNANISDIAESIDDALLRAQANKPLVLRNKILEATKHTVLESIRSIQNDQGFEKLVEWYLRAVGGQSIETPAKNESSIESGDADKVAYFEDLKIAVMVQVKKHKGVTDSWAIEQIESYKRNNLNDDYTALLWVISTCDDYSQEAKKLAQANGKVRLINGEQFAEMILNAGLSNLEL